MTDQLQFTMRAGSLARIIRTVAPAASTDDSKPLLTGILIAVDDVGVLSFTATDSYRLHSVVVASWWATAPFSVVVPARWLTRWASFQYLDRFDVEVRIAERRIEIETFGDLMSTGVIADDAKFPNFQALLDAATDHEPASHFNPTYISEAFEAAAEWSADHPLHTEAFHPTKPCKSRVDDPLGVLTMLVMPVRTVAP